MQGWRPAKFVALEHASQPAKQGIRDPDRAELLLQPSFNGLCDIWIVLGDEGIDVSVDPQDFYMKACDALNQISMKVVNQIAKKGKELAFSSLIDWFP